MKRATLVSLAASLCLTACPEPGGGAGDDSSTGSTGINPTLTPGVTSEPEPTTTGDTTEAPTTESGSSGSSTGEAPMFCDNFTPPAFKPVIPNVFLVLDKSASMVSQGMTMEPGEVKDGYWDHDNDPATEEVTRWRSLHEVVETLVASFDAKMNLGAVLFPSTKAIAKYDPAACPVDAAPLVDIGPMRGADILAAIPGAEDVTLKGGTPATKGVKVAFEQLMSIQDEEPKIVILVTDGAANCPEDATTLFGHFEEYDEMLPVTVAEAAGMGVATYVVGIDIADVESPVLDDGNPDATNTYQRLNELAEAAGTARAGEEKFYNAANQIELADALAEISKTIVSCEIVLDEPLPKSVYIDRVEVGDDAPLIYDTKKYDDEVADCAAGDGWHYIADDRSAIELCGAACERYKQTGAIEIFFGCTLG